MNEVLRGKRVKSYDLQGHEKLQRIGMMNKDLKNFDLLVDGTIEFVISRGNAIRVKLNNGMNLILGPEYGGKVFYHISEETVSSKFHLKVVFIDNTALTVRLTSMGIIYALKDNELEESYVYRRDFNQKNASPLETEFTFEHLSKLLRENNRMLKSVLVGKDAVLVGLSNSAFQDIIYRAKLHPKRKASTLDPTERSALYNAIKQVIKERIQMKGKDQFRDLYGNQGGYSPAMGPNMKQQPCPLCGTSIEKLSVGGGHVYFCPQCQV